MTTAQTSQSQLITIVWLDDHLNDYDRDLVERYLKSFMDLGVVVKEARHVKEYSDILEKSFSNNELIHGLVLDVMLTSYDRALMSMEHLGVSSIRDGSLLTAGWRVLMAHQMEHLRKPGNRKPYLDRYDDTPKLILTAGNDAKDEARRQGVSVDEKSLKFVWKNSEDYDADISKEISSWVKGLRAKAY